MHSAWNVERKWGNKKLDKVADYTMAFVASFTLPLVILIAICYSIFSSPQYYLSYNQKLTDNKFEESLKLDINVVEESLTNMLMYVKGKNENPQTTFEVNHQKVEFFNEREISHLSDIRAKMQTGKTIWGFMALFGIACMALLVFRQRVHLVARLYIVTLGVEIFVSFVIAVIYALNPLYMITLFHRLFFEGNTWIFNPATDRIIYFFPNGLYADMIIKALLVLLVEITCCVIGSVFLLRKKS